ncbi:BnaC04g44670D [Brassica napus]|uniref:BnaC04g44670D protein n=1 Tax=Brassica napus TaxID=3708 RepID=A0A078H3X9_BRANA|nr:BnaC04g44670D [Brassica napus]
MSPLTSFHRIAHDTFSSFLLSLVHSLSLSLSTTLYELSFYLP